MASPKRVGTAFDCVRVPGQNDAALGRRITMRRVVVLRPAHRRAGRKEPAFRIAGSKSLIDTPLVQRRGARAGQVRKPSTERKAQLRASTQRVFMPWTESHASGSGELPLETAGRRGSVTLRVGRQPHPHH